MKDKIKKILLFILNLKLLICIAIAWMITNGWSYVMLGIGTYCGIGWMIAVSSAYLTFLWLPISPEKIVTFAIALALLKLLFPKDQATLAVLQNAFTEMKEAIRSKKDKSKKNKND